VISQPKRWIQTIETTLPRGISSPVASYGSLWTLFDKASLGACILCWISSTLIYGQDPLTPPDRSKRVPESTAKDIPETPKKSEKQLEFKKEMITKEIEELNTKTVKLRGFILPTSVFQQSGIKQFVLVRDNQECCFGPGAALYDCVIVEMQAGKTANFSTRVVAVKGKLEVDSQSFQYPDGGHYAIYKMTAEEVK